MLTNRSIGTLLPLGLGAMLLLGGCGGDSGTEPVDTDLPEVNQYLQGLPAWDDFADVQPAANEPAGDEFTTMRNAALCTEEPYSITDNPDAIVTFGTAPNVLYLGSLIQGDSYLGGIGSMEELPIRQRAPLVIGIDQFSGTPVMDTVVDPNSATVQSSLNTLISDAFAGGQQTSNTVDYSESETHSLDQATLSLGLSVRGLASVSSQLAYESTREEHTITAFYKHVMFEAFIVTPQTPAEFFSDAFTKERLDEQVALGNIGPNNLPVYVGRMQYGRMMMYTMTSTRSATEMAAAVQASYGAVEGEVEAEYQQVLDEAHYKFVTIGGGDMGDVLSKLKNGGLKAYFEADNPITTAKPLAYTLYNLADGSIAHVSETTEYTITECMAENVECYLHRSEWEAVLDSLAPEAQVILLPTTADTLVMADEVDSPPGPNTPLGNVLTFDTLNTGYPFRFVVRAPESPGFTFDDKEGNDYHDAFTFDQARSLSPGDVGNDENDDIEIQFPSWRTNSAVLAFAMTVADNAKQSGEYTAVDGTGGLSRQFDACVPHSPGTAEGFLGVISTVPLTRVFFNERGDTNNWDDIYIRDFQFGVLEW